MCQITGVQQYFGAKYWCKVMLSKEDTNLPHHVVLKREALLIQKTEALGLMEVL